MEHYLLTFVVRDEGTGKRTELTVDSELARVGSGAHCEIRLPIEQAAIEQLRVEVRSGAVFAETRAVQPPTLLNGSPFTQGRLLPDSVLEVGSLKLSVVARRATHVANQAAVAKSSRSKFVYVLGAVGFPLGFWALWVTEPNAASQETAPVPAPELFAQAVSTCKETSPDAARALALLDLARASSAHERAPFDAAEGVSAVALYARAAACFRAAGDEEAASAATLSADALKRDMTQDFRLHQVRLEWAQATEHFDAARTEISYLSSFVAGLSDREYANWLSTLDRRIQLKFTAKKE